MGCPETGKHAGVVGGVVGKIQEGVVTLFAFLFPMTPYFVLNSSTKFTKHLSQDTRLP